MLFTNLHNSVFNLFHNFYKEGTNNYTVYPSPHLCWRGALYPSKPLSYFEAVDHRVESKNHMLAVWTSFHRVIINT